MFLPAVVGCISDGWRRQAEVRTNLLGGSRTGSVFARARLIDFLLARVVAHRAGRFFVQSLPQLLQVEARLFGGLPRLHSASMVAPVAAEAVPTSGAGST